MGTSNSTYNFGCVIGPGIGSFNKQLQVTQIVSVSFKIGVETVQTLSEVKLSIFLFF
jgi:hypothetical protein